MSRTPEQASIWIDTRNAIVRRGLAGCIADAGFAVAGESSALEPQPRLAEADVLLFDLEVLNGVLALTGVESCYLVALVPEIDEALLPAAVASGVSGYLVRSDIAPLELRRCLEVVAGGGRWYPSAPRRAGPFRRAAAGSLTTREVAVLRMLAGGSRTTEIASALSYSERMVKNIVHDVMTKMQCRTRAQAVAVVVRERVI